MDVWVNMASHEACSGGGRKERVVCARGKVWHGSGGGHKLAHSRRSDHAIASSTAHAVGRGLRLKPLGKRKWNAVDVCK